MRNPSVTDAELAELAKAGDQAAFGQLVERHGPAARRLAHSVLDDSADVDDAAQDGFLSAWRALDRFDSSRPFGPWLLRIVVNAAQDLRRRRRVRTTEVLSPHLAGAEAAPDAPVDRTLLRERLNAALRMLSERQRIGVVLFDAEGYSHAEIAELLGIPVGTVRSDVFHARRALRKALEGLSNPEVAR